MDRENNSHGYRTLIYFHTASGNTGWTTGQIAKQLTQRRVEVVTRNIAHQPDTSDIDDFTMIGFGCPVMGFRPAFSLTDFMARLPAVPGKLAFIYITCAGLSASSLWMLSQILNKKKWVVCAAHQFCAEVSWPVARLVGIMPNQGRPDTRDLSSIHEFCEIIYTSIIKCAENNAVTPVALTYAFLNPFSYIGVGNKPTYLRSIMGTKKVNESRCTRCGICQKYCASNAISLNPFPRFSSACTGCWGCYNICPTSAISTFIGTRGRYTSRLAYLDATPQETEHQT